MPPGSGARGTTGSAAPPPRTPCGRRRGRRRVRAGERVRRRVRWWLGDRSSVGRGRARPGRRGAVHHRDGDDPVEGDHRAGGERLAGGRTAEDLAASRCRRRRRASACTAAIAACSWYGPTGPVRERPADQGGALGDGGGVPAGAVLVGQRDERAVRAGAGRAARVGEQHEREQAGDLALVRERRVQLPGQPDRLGAELDPVQAVAGAGGVALVEDQVEHVQHDGQPRGRAPRPAASGRSRRRP